MDFYCAELKLALEVDGASHSMGDPEYDARRDADLARRGITVIRFPATEVLHNLDGVVAAIEAHIS